MLLIEKKYKILWWFKYFKIPLSGICEDDEFLLIFVLHDDKFYKLYSPPSSILLDLIDNQRLYLEYIGNNNIPNTKEVYYIGDYNSYYSKIKNITLQKSWEVDLIKIKNLII